MDSPKKRKREAVPGTTRSPEPGSIHAIIAENGRKRLYVRPIIWTVQPELLGCTFTLVAFPRDLPTHVAGAHQRVTRAATVPECTRWLIEPLRDAVVYKYQMVKITALLHANGLYPHVHAETTKGEMSDCLPFSFGGKRVAHVYAHGIFTRGLADLRPVLSIVRLESVRPYRKDAVFHNTLGRDRPDTGIRQKKLRMVTPANRLEDPYLMAHLITLGQAYREASLNTDHHYGPLPPSVKLWLLVTTTATDIQHLYLYETDMEMAFLDKFENPSVFTPATPPAVKVHHIPLVDAFAAATLIHKLLRPDRG